MMLLLVIVAFGLVAVVIGTSWKRASASDERFGAAALMLCCAMAFVAQLAR